MATRSKAHVSQRHTANVNINPNRCDSNETKTQRLVETDAATWIVFLHFIVCLQTVKPSTVDQARWIQANKRDSSAKAAYILRHHKPQHNSRHDGASKSYSEASRFIIFPSCSPSFVRGIGNSAASPLHRSIRHRLNRQCGKQYDVLVTYIRLIHSVSYPNKNIHVGFEQQQHQQN